jgi:gliding motility-associatede transport system auxiliary component
VLAILVAINYITKQQSKRWDLTAAKQYTLSDQSRNILAKLDAPLEVLVFDRETEFQRFRDRLREYESGSKQVKTEYVDPDRKPTVAQQHAVQQYGTLVLNYKGRTERVTTDTEQDITNGIIKVVSGQQRKVYFTQGHGEKDMASTERTGYNTITEALKRENYLIEPLPIAQRGDIPADAAVVIVAGPAIDFFPQEIDALKKYLANGGKLLLELDPPQKPDSPPLANLVALAREWGVEVGNDAILDVSGMGRLFGASEEVPVAVSYPPHAITQRFNVMTAYPLARSVTPASGGAGGRTAQAIVETGRSSWAESDLKSVLQGRPVKMEESGGDKLGPVSIAAAVSAPVAQSDPSKPAQPDAPKPETRVVVFGDSDFASNAAAGVAGNVDLFMNTVGWLSQQENLISVRPKEAADRRITLTAGQQLRINWLALAIIPGFIFGAGIMRWWRRR